MALYSSSGDDKAEKPEVLPMCLAKNSFLKEFGGHDYATVNLTEKRYAPIVLKKRLKKLLKTSEPVEEYDQDGNTIILMGETGCGKSTQVPQIVYRYLRKKFPNTKRTCIAITEPRRLAALTLAARVNEEMKSSIEGVIAHSVRFDTNFFNRTKIHFLTEGILLQQIMSDPFLLGYHVVIVDEAHERSIATDLILGHLRKLVYYRNKVAKMMERELFKLKVVIMTATGEASTLLNYFPGSKVLFIQGRTHPVKINYLSPSSQSDDYLSLTAATVMKLHNELPVDEHFLVFLTGQEEIEGVVKQLRATNHHFHVFVCPLYAALPKKAQENAFTIPPFGTRKIVVATNIAETSLTIPGIKVVIDSGFIKAKSYLSSHGLEAYQVQHISKSQAAQRAGRAGRECPGQVYRMYPKQDFDRFADYEEPEIKRSNLTQLHLMLPHFYKIDGSFKFIEDINPEIAVDAKLELEALDLINPLQDTRAMLTELGKRLSKFPIEPKLATVLYYSTARGVLEQVSSIISMMETENLFLPSNEDTRSLELQKFWAPEGDLITYLNIFALFVKSKNSKVWCDKNRISFRAMTYAFRVRKQLIDLMKRFLEEVEVDYKPLHNQNINMTIIHCFGKTIHWQRATMDPTGKYYRIENVQKVKHSDRLKKNRIWEARVRENPDLWSLNAPPKKILHAKIHPSSTLAVARPPEIIFLKATLNEKNDLFLHHCSVYDDTIANLRHSHNEITIF